MKINSQLISLALLAVILGFYFLTSSRFSSSQERNQSQTEQAKQTALDSSPSQSVSNKGVSSTKSQEPTEENTIEPTDVKELRKNFQKADLRFREIIKNEGTFIKNLYFAKTLGQISETRDQITILEESGSEKELSSAYDAQIKHISFIEQGIQTSKELSNKSSQIDIILEKLKKSGVLKIQETKTKYVALSKRYSATKDGSIPNGRFDESKEELDEILYGTQDLKRKVDTTFDKLWSEAKNAFKLGNSEMDNLLKTVANFRPDFEPAILLLKRAENRFRIVPLLKAAQYSEKAKKYSLAQSLYDEIKRLDPETEELSGNYQRIAKINAQTILKNQLQKGWQDIENKRFTEAKNKAFIAIGMAQIQNLDPESAQALFKRAKEDDRVVKIREFTREIERMEKGDNWKGIYRKAFELLQIQPNSAFATEKKAMASSILRANKKIELTIKEVRDTLEIAVNQIDIKAVEFSLNTLNGVRDELPQFITPEFESLEKKAIEIKKSFERPVKITLLSNRRTYVEIYGHGILGKFRERVVELSPGSYRARCSQSGYRDAIIEIVIHPNKTPNPITIIPKEKL